MGLIIAYILLALVTWFEWTCEQPCVTYREPFSGWATMQDIRQAHRYHGIRHSVYDGEYWFERDGKRCSLMRFKSRVKETRK